MTPQSPKAMTPEERAEWCIEYDNNLRELNSDMLQDLSGRIAEQIKLAEEEALTEDHKKALDVSGFVERAYAQGFSDAIESAAKEIESSCNKSMFRIETDEERTADILKLSKRIRDLKPKATEGK